MTRKGIGRLIPWLIALDIVLLVVFLAIRFAMPQTAAGETTVEKPKPMIQQPQSVTAETPAPFDFGEEPEQLLVDLSGLERPAETALPVGEIEQDATLISGSFALRGGPNFSLYLDADTFQLIENEGRCYFCPVSESGTLYLEVAYHPNADAKTLASSILWDYGIIIQATDVEQTTLNGQDALHLSAKTMETQYDAALIACDGGCVSLVLCAPGGDTTKQHQALAASMQTFLIQK